MPLNLVGPLNILSEKASNSGFSLISAIVVNKKTKIPGAGFFNGFGGGIPSVEWKDFF